VINITSITAKKCELCFIIVDLFMICNMQGLPSSGLYIYVIPCEG